MEDNPPFSFDIVTLPPEEWPAYRRLRLEALQNAPQAFGSAYTDQVALPDDFWRERLQRAAKGEDQWLRFACSNSGLLGMTGAVLEPPGDLRGGGPTAMVVSVYVTPAARGQGVARALMQAVLEVLKVHGVKRAKLGVVVTQAAARRMYESFGFMRKDTVHQLMGDGLYHDEWMMEREL